MKPLRRAAFPLCALAAAALAIFAYSNTFENVFQMDDYHVLVNNGYVRSLRNVPLFFRDARTFGSEVTNQTYRPLVSTSLAIDYAIGGGRTPFVFRLTQLTLMLASGALLYFVYRLLLDGAGESSLNRWLALGASTLFVVHTANSEVANYVSSRSDLLSTMGVVGSFAVYLGWPRRRRAQLHLLPMAMGALAKTPSLMYAPMIVAHRWLYETEGDWRARLRAAIVPALPAFAVSVVLFIFIESRNPPTQTYGGGPWYDYALSQPFCWLHYARLFFVPAGLTADYGWKPVAHAYDTRVFAGAAFLLLLAWAIVRAARTQALRPASFGLCWFALALLPTSSVIPISEVVKESRVFFPNVGLAIAVVTSLSYFMNTLVVQWSSRAIAVTSLGSALVLGSLAIATRERNRDWSTLESFWRDVAEKAPENPRGLMSYGVLLLNKEGNEPLSQAKDLLERAHCREPDYALGEVNLGMLYARLGDPQAAEAHYARALALRPDYPVAHSQAAMWLASRGRGPEALEHLRRAVELSPADLSARVMLLNLDAALGRDEALAALVQQSIAVAADDPTVRSYAAGRTPMADDRKSAEELVRDAEAALAAGRPVEAALSDREALRRDPRRAAAWSGLGAALSRLGFAEEAKAALDRALALEPDLASAKRERAGLPSSAASDPASAAPPWLLPSNR